MMMMMMMMMMEMRESIIVGPTGVTYKPYTVLTFLKTMFHRSHVTVQTKHTKTESQQTHS